MKKFLICIISIILIYGIFDYLFFYQGSIYIPKDNIEATQSKSEGEKLWIDKGDGFEVFDIKGVNLGLGKPGKYATEYSITKNEYLKWFREIQDMGANVIRIYTLAHEAFYEAFYEYNVNNPNPLYLIHGVWVDDYLINSSYSALDKAFYEPFLKECKNIVDAIHGRYKTNKLSQFSTQHYDKDISQWVYGYILGIEWEDTLVVYTDEIIPQQPQYKGKYFYTEDGSNFEIFLAQIGDAVATYESEKYGQQRAIALSNWATTDPFVYPEGIKDYFRKVATVDVEKIKTTDQFKAAYFASYHIYPYYPDYYSYFENAEENTYLQYLKDINEHHKIPVVISEFGVPSSRGMAAYESSLKRNQGFMSEVEQGHAIISMYEDIKKAGSAGGIVFTWQDEWFKRTWNTMANVDLNATPYWSDYQTNEQYFGLLAFDPGKDKSISYIDGNKEEWQPEERVIEGEINLSVKYDEKFLYFLVEKDGLDINKDKLYIPIDTAPKSGGLWAEGLNVSMSEAADFIIEIDGKENSRVWVHERYDTIQALYADLVSLKREVHDYVPPVDSAVFNKIYLLLQKDDYYHMGVNSEPVQIEFNAFQMFNTAYDSVMQKYETGKLVYGNANPSAQDFNSLADFMAGDGFVEIKLPWGVLNFANPVEMKIHDDYYQYYGVEYHRIEKMQIGVGDGEQTIMMEVFPLKKLGRKPTYHERLKASYYILQDYWTKDTLRGGEKS